MAEVVHTSHVTIIQKMPPIRTAFIEKFDDPVTYGMHGGIAEFYGVESKEEYPATLDHMIAAIGAWLTGTFAGALVARKITAFPDNLTATVEGDISKTAHTIKITEIRVLYHLRIPADKKSEADRALEQHPEGCPAYQSVNDSIAIKIETEYELE